MVLAGLYHQLPGVGETVMTDLREIGPTITSRRLSVFENLLTDGDDPHGRRRCDQAKDLPSLHGGGGAAVPTSWMASRCRLGDLAALCAGQRLLVYGPLKNVLGMSRIAWPTRRRGDRPDLFRFTARSASTSSSSWFRPRPCARSACSPMGEIRFGQRRQRRRMSRSKRSPTTARRGPRPHAAQGTTSARRDRRTIDADGWFTTGDAGFFDADGHLKIIDRAKDVGKLAGGAMFAPNYIENKLKFFQHIKEAVCFGDNRDHGLRLHQHRHGAVGNWAERRNAYRLHRPGAEARGLRADQELRREGQRDLGPTRT